jgi:CelD/BcsL family acetyltransferase involved in cellulose biosynthesis
LPHLKAFRSDHSYLTGFLFDRDEGEAALRVLFDFFRRNGSQWHGLDFEHMPSCGAQAELVFRVAREFGCSWHERMRTPRAVFVPVKGGDTYLQAHLSVHRLKRLRQGWRRLERKGIVRWKTLYGQEVTASHIESFLDLEHRGWKAEKGTSIRSHQSHEAFFREMVEGFRKGGCLFFTELLLNETVIASTSNLVSGGVGFAFKIGWNPDYSDASPGLMNELAFVRDVKGPCRSLSYIDSGAEGGSFVDSLWKERRVLTSGIFDTTSIARMVLSGADKIRKVRRRWQRARPGLKGSVCTME